MRAIKICDGKKKKTWEQNNLTFSFILITLEQIKSLINRMALIHNVAYTVYLRLSVNQRPEPVKVKDTWFQRGPLWPPVLAFLLMQWGTIIKK